VVRVKLLKPRILLFAPAVESMDDVRLGKMNKTED
jgi:hypothetical protein